MKEQNNNPFKDQQPVQQDQQKPRSGAFNEPDRNNEKSTTNIEEEAGMEQERKDAMTERD